MQNFHYLGHSVYLFTIEWKLSEIEYRSKGMEYFEHSTIPQGSNIFTLALRPPST